MVKLSLQQIVETLNRFLTHDPLAFSHLVELRIDCGPLKIATPGLTIHTSFYGRPLMGVVELLNNLFDDDRAIEAIRHNGKVKQFVLRPRTKLQVIKPIKRIKPKIRAAVKSVCKSERRRCEIIII